MTIHYTDDWLTVLHGDVRDELRTLPDESVHCVITSPPYWGLRDYGAPDQLGLEPTPEQYVENMVAVFREVRRVLRSDGTLWLNLGDSYAGGGQTGRNDGGRPEKGRGWAEYDIQRTKHERRDGLKPKDLVGIPWRVAFALQADGWVLRSDVVWSKPNPMPESVTDRPTKSHEMLFLFSKAKRIGPEPTVWDDIPDADARWLAGIIDAEGSIVLRREVPKGNDYGGHSAQVSVGNTSRALLDEVARIAGGGNILERAGQNAPMWYWQASNKVALGLLRRLYPFLIVKQRQARCVIALEEGKAYTGGVRLTSTEIARRERLWEAVKSLNHFGDPDLSGIPEPVFGRWTSQPYYFDADAVRERGTTGEWTAMPPIGGVKHPGNNGNATYSGNQPPSDGNRNIRSVWTIATAPYPGAHFATFPPKLVEPCIKAGTSEKGVCPECGAPWERVVEREPTWAGPRPNGELRERNVGGRTDGFTRPQDHYTVSVTTTGWRPSCVHGCGANEEGLHIAGHIHPVPATILDPFAGSGTTGMVAQSLSRRAVLIDLNVDYLAQLMERNRAIPLGLGESA